MFVSGKIAMSFEFFGVVGMRRILRTGLKFSCHMIDSAKL